MAPFYLTLILAASAAARGITEAPSVITPAAQADCPLTNSIPGCGIGCLISAGGAAGCSNPFDLACQCKAASQIRSLASPCVTKSCGQSMGSSLESVAAAICTQCTV
ncbi:hypothetical protein C8A01DRAFT_20685 [Parachaetomium inaequale]|uniref:CFEM domain-containing protein n=1 Tax=Parachaetomium inaequale TaxID=2588326 RepID=A0AAN6SKY1_9PEZI|nr:hypothetical protein C8A01DRAFT_20685 [Parachaetomium inaequale]